MKRTYTELTRLKTFKERFDYLRLNGKIGEETFGYNRYINQKFYKSYEWKRVRSQIIIRDGGCDLGMEGHEIPGRIIIHHINPITEEDIINKSPLVLDPENLITCSEETHDYIHYNNDIDIYNTPVVRQKNDTCPWR